MASGQSPIAVAARLSVIVLVLAFYAGKPLTSPTGTPQFSSTRPDYQPHIPPSLFTS